MPEQMQAKSKTRIDLIGQKFGRWTVLYEGERRIFKGKPILRVWHCRCSCGTEKDVYQTTLLSGGSLSCGCLQKDNMKKTRRDLTGKQFHRWKVLYEVEPHIDSKGIPRRMWHCKCTCGIEKDIYQGSLEKGQTKSCGCWHKEKATEQGKSTKKYNQFDLSKEYGIGYTRKGIPFYFDKEDYELIKDYCWLKGPGGYIVSHQSDSKEWVFLHRLVMNICEENMIVDHINHTKTDSRKCNLRIVNKSQNAMNSKVPSNNTSGYKGVSWSSRNQKWVATIRINGKTIYLGSSHILEEAIQYRKIAEDKYFGEYSYDSSQIIAIKNKIKE